MAFNGPVYETAIRLPDGLSYCVRCGTIMVYHSERDCPSCTLAERLDDLEDQIGGTEDDDA